MAGGELEAQVQHVLNQAPDWIRRDLLSSDPVERARAEETLAIMIAADLRKNGASAKGPR